MAALSCYQPCRSHLAQPARCLADDEEDVPHPTFSLRRRQFERSRERCPREAAVAAGPRRVRDEPPRREELTRHVREDPARHVREDPARHVREDPARHVREDPARLVREDPRHAGPAAPRRLNVDHGWSKVEEVRKKFEGAAASASFSRSFESPPRRRLADSLFASFKLPRKKDANMAASRSLAPQHQHKRKSAVELLAETKAFYVKSETVLDRKQELPLRVSSGLSQAIAQGGCHLVSSGTLNNDACCNIYATARSTASLTRRAGGTGGCGAPLGSELQNTLRRLLEHEARQHKYPPGYATHKIYAEPRRVKDYIERETMPRSQHTSGTFSGTSSSGTSGSKAHKSEPEREKANRPLSFGDARVFFPESFVIPRQRPSEVVIKGAYSIPSSHSSPEHPQAVVVGAGEGALSPAQAHYAHSAPRYIRSNSHSQPSVRAEDGCANINSHKSLPDLHSQARQYPEHAAPGATDTIGRSPRRRRHSTHQRTASCSSKGTRSNHSSLLSSCDAFSEHPSPGEENYQSYNSRCGSSFARDSGGSSGHYTQRSAPPHHHQHRTDSGSSTQHDQSRHNYYPCGRYSPVGPECLAPAPPQFQDGAPSPPAAPPPPHLARVGIHFQASAPPPQFQDEPPPPPHDYKDYECSYKPLKPCLPLGRKDYPRERDRDYGRYHIPAAEADGAYEPTYAEPRHRPRPDDTQEYVNATQICPTEEVTSPLGTFKRQRCLRYKQRRPRPILRSKSDISDRYRRTDGRSPASAPCEGDESPDRLSDESTRLEQFFERLGLDPRQYDAIVRERAPHSPVYFSSASTVDSNQLPATADYTVQGPGVQKQIYRNTEPPSVVERNARIIKWLCQCRKTQAQPPQ